MHLTEKRKNRITLPKMKAGKESGHSSPDGIKSILLACSGQGLRHKQGMQCGRIIWQNFFVCSACVFPFSLERARVLAEERHPDVQGPPAFVKV